MNEQIIYDNLYELSPQYPLAVLEFLKTELQLGKKYVVMDVHTHNGQLSKLLQKHVHLICSLSVDANYAAYLKEKFKNVSNFLSLTATPELISVEEDSIDCICIDNTFNKFDVLRMGVEFERVLRLNSYVLVLNNDLVLKSKSFSVAFDTFLKETNIVSNYSELKNETLEEFYSNKYQKKQFANQQRLTWDNLKAYYQHLAILQGQPADENSLKALRKLFEAHEQDERVILEYRTVLYYGLFNHSVPEISLRKSIFFNVLRPFAFGFYVLVKSNIYFWRALYKIKDKLFSRRTS